MLIREIGDGRSECHMGREGFMGHGYGHLGTGQLQGACPMCRSTCRSIGERSSSFLPARPRPSARLHSEPTEPATIPLPRYRSPTRFPGCQVSNYRILTEGDRQIDARDVYATLVFGSVQRDDTAHPQTRPSPLPQSPSQQRIQRFPVPLA